jgi:PleD family two-component response regulator
MQAKYVPQILVIDPDKSSNEAIQSFLVHENCNLHFAENAADGMQMIFEIKPDLILVELMLPAYDGLELFKSIRKEPSLRFIPVIMISKLNDRDVVKKCLDASIDDFFHKPFKRLEFRTKIRSFIQMNRTVYFKTINRLEEIIREKEQRISILEKQIGNLT